MFFVSGFLGIILLEFIFDEFIFLNNMPFVTVGWPDLTIFVFVFIIVLIASSRGRELGTSSHSSKDLERLGLSLNNSDLIFSRV